MIFTISNIEKEQMQFRLRKYPKKAEKDELITMLQSVNRVIKRSTSKSKLSY